MDSRSDSSQRRSSWSDQDDCEVTGHNHDNDDEKKAKEESTTLKVDLGNFVPTNYVSLTTANGMLIYGSHQVPGRDCQFPLIEYLLITGTITLALVHMSGVIR